MLPYQSMEQAKIAMGRELSASEKIWFNYSSQKPDIVLHSHNFLFLCFFYSIFPLPYIFLELIGSNHVSKFKIQHHINRSLWDMFRCYKSVMLTFVIAVCPLQVLSYPTLKWIGIRSGLPLPSGWEMCVQIMMYFLIEDYTHYWVHRMLHCKWWYQNIHYLHHQYTAPMALSAPYAHWAEILILGLPSFIGPALVPCHIITYWLWFVLRQMEATEIHSGYDFKWSPTKHIPFYGGAEYHDYHHYVGGQSHSNFASVFTYCDYIYGTDKGYRHQKSISKRKHL